MISSYSSQFRFFTGAFRKTKRRTCYSLLACVIIVATISFAEMAHAQPQQPSVSLDPSSYVATSLNETFTVNITISNVQSLWGWEANITWDPHYLNLLGKHEGGFIKDQVDSTFFSATKVANNVVNLLDACSSSGSEEDQAASGSGILATMQFQVIKQTLSTSLLLSDISLLGPNQNNATTGTAHPIITPASDLAMTTISLVIVGPPTANAGEDQSVQEGTRVVLNASESISTGTGTTYIWTFMDVTQQTLTGMIANYTFNNPGIYSITLTVQDSLGSDESNVTITVQNVTTTIRATTSSGTSIYFAISGNITSSQMSDVTLATSQSINTTTVSFTLTGQDGTTGFGNITIPRSAIAYGITPTTFIDGQAAQEQGYLEDKDNYYVWYTTQFSTHEISIVFATVTLTPATPTTTPTVESFSFPPTILGILIILTIFVLGGSSLWLRKRTNKI
jgi:PKD repeat protein